MVLIIDTLKGPYEVRFTDVETEKYYIFWSGGLMGDLAFDSMFELVVSSHGVLDMSLIRWHGVQTPIPISDEITKERRYLAVGEHPPEGRQEQRGPRGGRYYETEVGTAKPAEESSVFAPKDEENEDYMGTHRPPGPEDGASLDDVTGGGNIYPDDFYSRNGLRYYGTGDARLDAETYSLILRFKGKPNADVTIYRAVPHLQTGKERLDELEQQMKQYMARHVIPKGEEEEGWYDRAWMEREQLRTTNERAGKIDEITEIHRGDWVTINRNYAKGHGESVLYGAYKIISKKVKAKEIFTNGDSLHEWGYYPEGGGESKKDGVVARYLEGEIELGGNGVDYGGAVPGEGALQVILERGRSYKWRPTPKHVEKGVLGDCFENATVLSLRSDYQYCEGYATAGIFGASPGPVFHAWCIDAEGYVVDPSWPDRGGEDREYYGVVFERDELIDIITRSKFYGIFGELSWKKARKAMGITKEMQKEKIYLREGEKPPEGRQEKTGPRGGRFYEGTREEKEAHDKGQAPKEDKPDEKVDYTVDPVAFDETLALMDDELTSIFHAELRYDEVSGSLHKDNIGKIGRNVYRTITSASNYLAGDTVDLLHGFTNIGLEILRDNPTLDAGIVNEMMLDSMYKLLFQEVQSNRQQYNDHGIRHIVKNIQMQEMLLSSLQESGLEISSRERLMAYFIMVNHDMGYTAGAVRQGGIEGIKASSNHPKYSREIMEKQKSIWDEGHLFSEEEFERICGIIETHDSPSIDVSDPVGLAVRISDNMALFHKEKLPSMFKYVDGSMDVLKRMGLYAKAGDKEAFGDRLKELEGLIDKSDMGERLKRDLKMGVREITMMTPKFSMGTLAGEVSEVKRGIDSVVDVSIDFNEFDQFLQQYFDMGQNQLRKLLKTYGIEEYDRTEYNIGEYQGKPIVRILVNQMGREVQKEKKYLKPGERPPKGYETFIGPRGGRYYHTNIERDWSRRGWNRNRVEPLYSQEELREMNMFPPGVEDFIEEMKARGHDNIRYEGCRDLDGWGLKSGEIHHDMGYVVDPNLKSDLGISVESDRQMKYHKSKWLHRMRVGEFDVYYPTGTDIWRDMDLTILAVLETSKHWKLSHSPDIFIMGEQSIRFSNYTEGKRVAGDANSKTGVVRIFDRYGVDMSDDIFLHEVGHFFQFMMFGESYTDPFAGSEVQELSGLQTLEDYDLIASCIEEMARDTEFMPELNYNTETDYRARQKALLKRYSYLYGGEPNQFKRDYAQYKKTAIHNLPGEIASLQMYDSGYEAVSTMANRVLGVDKGIQIFKDDRDEFIKRSNAKAEMMMGYNAWTEWEEIFDNEKVGDGSTDVYDNTNALEMWACWYSKFYRQVRLLTLFDEIDVTPAEQLYERLHTAPFPPSFKPIPPSERLKYISARVWEFEKESPMKLSFTKRHFPYMYKDYQEKKDRVLKFIRGEI